jgi:hypothetical protein
LNFSQCTNPVIENSINYASSNITKGGNPSESLNSLTNVILENEIASGNIFQLDQTIKLAIDKQTDLMIANTDSNSRDSSSKIFVKSVIDLYDVVFVNGKAFWGLEWIPRSGAVDQVQKNVDDTLFLLAENLLDGIYLNFGPFRNICNQPKLEKFLVVFVILIKSRLRFYFLQLYKWKTDLNSITTTNRIRTPQEGKTK